MTREERLIKDIKKQIDTEKFIQEHVIIYKAIKYLVKIYDEEMVDGEPDMRGEE